MHHIVERRLGYRAVLQSLLEAAEIVAGRLLLIESIHCVDCTVSRAPVRRRPMCRSPGYRSTHHELDRANFSLHSVVRNGLSDERVGTGPVAGI
jgi:hypothetical protein